MQLNRAALKTGVGRQTIYDIEQGENLVQAGLIDSLAVLEIVAFLETEFGVDFADTGVDTGRLTTIPSLLDLIDQHTA